MEDARQRLFASRSLALLDGSPSVTGVSRPVDDSRTAMVGASAPDPPARPEGDRGRVAGAELAEPLQGLDQSVPAESRPDRLSASMRILAAPRAAR